MFEYSSKCTVMFDLTSFGLGKFSKFHNHPENFNIVKIEDMELFFSHVLGLTKGNYYFVCNGRKLKENDEVDEHNIIHVIPKLFGGKGGFGSMLRAIGAQIEKTTNREACRDLSGRRLRDINEEQRLKNWIAQQAEREKEAADRKKKKLERLCREPKHDFKDDSYNQARSELAEKVTDSVEQGFKASGSGATVTGIKRKEIDLPKNDKKKKKKLWIDVEDDTSTEESDSADENGTSSINRSKCIETELSPDLPLSHQNTSDVIKSELIVPNNV